MVSKETAARDGASNKTPVWYEPRSKQQTPTGGRLPCSLTARGATGMASPRSAAAVGADDDWAALCSLEAALEADLRVAETASAERSQFRGDAEGTSDGTSAVAALDARAATYWNAPRRRSENVAPSDLGDGRASEGTWAPADLGASSRRGVASSRGRPTYSPHHGAYGDYTNRLLHRPGREPLRARVGDSSVPSLNAPGAFELAVDDVVGAWILPKSSTDSTRRAGTTATREAPSTTRKTLFATNHAVPSSAPRKLATKAEASPRTSDSERLTKLAEPRGRGSPRSRRGAARPRPAEDLRFAQAGRRGGRLPRPSLRRVTRRTRAFLLGNLARISPSVEPRLERRTRQATNLETLPRSPAESLRLRAKRRRPLRSRVTRVSSWTPSRPASRTNFASSNRVSSLRSPRIAVPKTPPAMMPTRRRLTDRSGGLTATRSETRCAMTPR